MIRGELRVALAGILALVTLIAFEALAVATAMPVAATALGGLRYYGLAFSFFLTASLLGMVLAGTWNDVRGPLAPVVAGLSAFSLGLVVSGLAPDFGVLLAGRALAGLGGGVLVVTLYVVVGALFEGEARPRVFAWLSSAWVVPALVGPPLAGWLAAAVSWRAVFLVVPPLALAVFAVLARRLAGLARPAGASDVTDASPGLPPHAGRRRALTGLVLAFGAALAQTGATRLDPLRPAPVIAVVLGAAGIAVALPRLLPVGTLRLARGLPSVVAARGLFSAAFTGAESYVPFMLVVQRGLSPATAGLALTGGAIGWASGSFVLGLRGRWAVRVPRHKVMAAGGVVVALAVALLILPALGLVPATLVLWVWTVGGFGMGLGLTSTSVLVLAMAPEAERGRASSALQLSDALGTVLGIGTAAAVLAARPRPGQRGDDLAWIFAGLAVVGVLAALAGSRVRAPEATESRGGPRGRAPSASVGIP